MYTIETNQISRVHVELPMCKNYHQEYLHNVYELPSIEPTIRYLHGVAGFPTIASWLKAIRKGNYLSWPLINVKNVTKYFPESEEIKRGICTANAKESAQREWLHLPKTGQPIFHT